MKLLLNLFLVAASALSGVHAQWDVASDFDIANNPGVDFNSDGLPDMVLYHAGSGNLSVGLGDPAAKWHFTNSWPVKVTGIEIKSDSNEFVVADSDANRVLLFEGQRDGSFETLEFPVAGPVGAGFADVVKGGPLEIVTLATGGTEGPELLWLEADGKTGPKTWPNITLKRGYVPSFRVVRIGTDYVAVGASQSASGREEQFFTIQLESANVANIQETPIDRRYTLTTDAATLDGKPSTILWDQGHTTLAVGLIIPAVQPAIESASVGFPVGGVSIVPAGVNDRILIISEDGEIAELFGYANGKLTERQSFAPPNGQSFAAAHALADGDALQFVLKDANGNLTKLLNYANSDGIYTPQNNQTNLNPLLSKAAKTTVVAYTENPLLHADAFEIERFAQGSWATGAKLQGGGINAQTELFGGVLPGLGNPMSTNLNPVSPVVGVIGNQYEADSSICHLGASGFSGNAAVAITPPAGSYGFSVGVGFQTQNKNTKVIYRANGGDWKEWTSNVFLSKTTTIDFYGQHNSGVLSPVQSATYDIEQSFGFADANDDGLPDWVAAAFGLDPFGDGNADGDAFSDFDELLGGSDPNDPESIPEKTSLSSDIHFRVMNATSDGALEGATGGEVSIVRLDGSFVAGREIDRNGVATIPVDVGTTGGIAIAIFTRDLPNGTVLEMASGLIGNGAPLLPSGDLSAAEWIAETKTIIGGFKTMRGMDSETELIEISPKSTLGILVFEQWLGEALVTSGAISDAAEAPKILPPKPFSIPEIDDEVLVAALVGQQPLAHGLAQAMRASHNAAAGRSAPELHKGLVILANNMRSSFLPALRKLFIHSTVPPTYVDLLKTPSATLAQERAALIGFDSGEQPISVSGALRVEDSNCLVITASNGTTYVLAERDGSRYWPSTAIAAGSTANATGVLLPGVPRCADRSLYVLSLSVIAAPTGSITDTDNDGIDDTYEEAFYGTLAFGASDDPDGDGTTLGESFNAGAPPSGAPINPPPSPETSDFDIALGSEANQLILSWKAAPGKAFVVNTSADLLSWRPGGGTVEEPFPGLYRWQTTAIPNRVRLQFFQVAQK